MKAPLYLVLATLFWSGNFVVGQAAVASMTPLELTFWRWTLAAVPLLLLAHFVEKPDWRAVLRRWPVLLLLSVLGMSGYTLLLYGALGYTSAMNASLITAANPALIVVMAIVLLGERTTRLGWLGICLGLLGVLLVLTQGELARVFSLSINTGELMMIGAIIVWGFYTIIARRLKVPAISATAVQVVIATVTLAPFALAMNVQFPDTAAEGWSLAYIALFPSLGSYLLWNLALKTTPPGTAGNYLNLMVVFTAIITVLLGTPLTLVQIVGGLMVIAGVLLTGIKGQPRLAAPAAPTAGAPEPRAAAGRTAVRPCRRHAGSPVMRQDAGTALPGLRAPLLPEIFDGERFDPPRVDPQGRGGPAEEGSVHGTDHVCVPGGEAMERAVHQHQSPAAVVRRAVALPRQEVRERAGTIGPAGGFRIPRPDGPRRLAPGCTGCRLSR